jgi:hypothetical protein
MWFASGQGVNYISLHASTKFVLHGRRGAAESKEGNEMAERVPINPGTGPNGQAIIRGIYLKLTGDGPFVALSLYFKVVLSPHGRGTAMLILGDPDAAQRLAGRAEWFLSPIIRYWAVTCSTISWSTCRLFAAKQDCTVCAFCRLTAAHTTGDPA